MKIQTKAQAINLNDLNDIKKNLMVIRYDANDKIKVAAAGDSIYKFFYDLRKSWLKKKYKSAAANFVKNASYLKVKDVNSLNISAFYFCKEEGCHLVVYDKLPGDSVYELAYDHGNLGVLQNLAKFIAELHSKNIYFRAGHCDNYLYEINAGKFSIIDIDNLRFSLSVRQKAKNIFYLYHHSYRKGSPVFTKYSFSEFLDTYFKAAKLNQRQFILLRFWLNRYLSKAGYEKIANENTHGLSFTLSKQQ